MEKNFSDETKAHFNFSAADYDNSFDGKYVKPMYDFFENFFKERKEGTILDVGCGTGNVLKMLQNGKRRLFGIDLAENMVLEAEKCLGDQAVIEQANVCRLPFQNEFFDYLICNASFHHYPEPVKALDEMSRVMKKGAVMIIGEGYAWQPFRLFLNLYFHFGNTGDYRSYGRHEMIRMLDKKGLQIKSVTQKGMRIFFVAIKQ